MTESTSLLPSEIARLVLGYINAEGYPNTVKTFMKECHYLTEYITLRKQGRELPISVAGLTLTFIIDEYFRLKHLEQNLETRQNHTYFLVDQLQKIATILKFSEKPNTGTFSQSVSQGARMKRQINENKSPQKTIGTLKPTESSARVAGSTLKPTESSARVSGNAGNRNITSPTQGTQTYFISNNMDVLNVTSVTDVTAVTDDTAVSDVTSIDVTSVDDLSAVNNTPGPLIVTVTPVNKQAGSSTIVPGPERLESCNRRLQELFERNSSPGPKSKTGSSSTGVHSNVNNVSNNSAINGNETVQCDKQTAQDVQTASSNSILVETNDNLESHGGENSREKSVNERTCPTTQSEFTPSTSRVSDKTSNLEDREPPPKEVPKPPEKPGTSEVTNSNTCDSWYNGAPGVKGGDKLLEKFGIQQSSSTDSTDQEVVEHMQAPVTPTKSHRTIEIGLVTPEKHLQNEEQTNKSPRRKKPKTPRKRRSDVNKTPSKRRSDADKQLSTSGTTQEEPPQEQTVHAVKKVVQHMIHDETVLAKLTEISNTIIDHRQNRSHNKSGDEEPHQGPTAEELETIAASKSLEEILETESFGQDLNLDLSDPVFEGLFKLFGTDKEAFHENLRQEKHKTLAMQAEVEELEKSIHEEIAEHCEALIGSQGDEGYETQRTPENIYGSPKPSCSSQTGTLEMSSPISQPYTPHSQIQETSFTSSPREKENAVLLLAENEPVHSPIQPCSPYSNQSDLFSPASHVTHPFSPALTEQSYVSEQQSSTPQHNGSAIFSPSGEKTLEPESPHPADNVSIKSPAFIPSSPHIVHQNPPQSPDELTPALASRRTPIPCSPLVKNDIQPGTPHMVQKYNTPFTPQSKHKSIMAAGTVRHLFSPQVYSPTTKVYSPTPQVYSPTTQQNAQVMIQTNLKNGVPQFTQEVEVNATSQTGTQTSTNQSMNYTNFVSGVNTADSSSTPINVRSASVFHGDPLTTIDNTIGCISLPPSQSAVEMQPQSAAVMPPPQEKGKGKGKRGNKGKEKKIQKKAIAQKAQPGGFSTLIGLLSKPPQVSTVDPQPETSTTTSTNTSTSTLSMPLLTEQSDPDTVVAITEQADPGTVLLNALEDDIHNNSISILSPGGHNLIELPILRCQDVDTETETPKEGGDIVSQAMSASNVISDNETVCVWSQNLNTSTQLTIFSPPPDSVVAVPGTDTHVTDSGIRDLEVQVQNNVPVKDNIQKSVKKSSKKKLNLDNVDNARKQLATSSAARDTKTQFCQPGEMLIAEPFHSANPQKKIFMRSLNFGPNAGTTKGSMMPSRKAAKGSALAPFSRKKSTDKSSDFSTVSVNLTKDIRYRKIMPKPSGQIPVAINIVPANQTSEMAATEETVTETSDSAVPCTDDNDHAVLCTDDNDHYDSDTLSCGTFSPMKRRNCDKLPSQNISKSKTGDQTSDNKLNPKANPKQSKSPRKINPTKTHKDSTVGGQKMVSPKSRNPTESRQTKKSPECSQKEIKKAPKCSQKETKKSQKCTKKVNDDKLMAVCDEKKLNEANANTVNEKGDLKNNQAADNNKHDKGNEMKKSQTETLQFGENSKTGKGKTVSRRGRNKEDGNKKQESSKEINTKDTLKKVRRKAVRSLMKVKIVSSKAKSPTDRNKQLKLCKSGNKIFMKSPVIREQKKSKNESVEITTDSDTDEELSLNVLKDLHKTADDVNETVQEVDEAVNDSSKQKEASAEQNSKLNEPVPDFCPRTPEKAVKSPVNPDTPSQEQVLEKLGLTPKKNAEEILQNLQSPSRKLLDMFVQLTPVDKRKTPRRRKGQNHSDDNSMRSPSRSIKTPNKRLFGSPDKFAANPRKTAAKSNVASQSTSARSEKSVVQNKKSKPKSDKVDVGKNGDNDSDLEPRKDKVVKKAEKEKIKPTVKGKGKLIMKEKSKPSVKSSQEDKEKKSVENKKSQSLESLKKEEKTVTPLKLINLLGEIKVDCARNKQSKGSKKRQRDDSDKELENEISKDKPTKKARNSMDLSVLDYDKLMSKLSKIHK